MSDERLAEVLRLADFALERNTIALIAFARPFEAVERDAQRNDEVRRLIAAELAHLPPEPPLTAEQKQECAAVLDAVVRSFGEER